MLKKQSYFALLLFGFFIVITGLTLCGKNIHQYYFDTKSKALYSLPAITVVIPVAPKDASLLPFVIERLKKNLQNPIYNIVILGPKEPVIMEQANTLKVEFLDENIIYNKKFFTEAVKSILHSKKQLLKPHDWYYQQVLKYYYANFSPTIDYFVLDADIIINHPFTLKDERGYTFFRRPDEPYQKVYACALEKLLEVKTLPYPSFVADMMIFNRVYVKSLLSIITAKSQRDFVTSIIQLEEEYCIFSEYETYGFYVTEWLVQPAHFKPSTTFKRSRKNLIEDMNNLYLTWKYPYIGYHHYMDDK